MLFIALQDKNRAVTHTELAQCIPVSTSYLSKILTLLTKNGLLIAHRGPSGGFQLSMPPEQITLLDIVEACEGKILGDYCKDTDDLDKVCAFHHAMYEVRNSLIKTLMNWSLAKLMKKPLPDSHLLPKLNCKMKPLSLQLQPHPAPKKN